jgi:spore maturation protein B
MNKILIIFILVIFIDALFKHINIFHSFLTGVKKSFSIIKPLFTSLLAFLLFVQCLKSSGFINILQSLFLPLCDFLKVPIDIIILAILRPISANASLSYLYQFYNSYGVDHTLSLLATLIQCGSDTTLYVISLYFSSLKMKNTRYALPLSLFLDFLAVLIALLFYRLYL